MTTNKQLTVPASELDLINKLINSAEEWAAAAVGGDSSLDDPEYQAWRRGEIVEHAIRYIGATEDVSRKAFRLYVYRIYKEELWRLVRVLKIDTLGDNLFDDDGEQQFNHFATFDDWFNHLTGPVNSGGLGLADATKSALWHGVTELMRLADQGLIEGHTVEGMAALDEGKWQTMATVVNQTMQPDHEKPDQLKFATDLATDPTITRQELVSELQIRGIIGRKMPKFPAKWVREGDKTLVLLELDDEQYRSASIGLNRRVEWEASTLPDMIDALEDYRRDDEPSSEDLADMLRRKADNN